jgi:hypothetical protein
MDRQIKERNIFLVYLYSVLSFGIYSMYWMVSTKRDINSLGGEIPSTWICVIPFAGIYYNYKYCESFAKEVKKDGNTIMYFCLSMFLWPVIPALVQSSLNNPAGKKAPVRKVIKRAA